MTWLSASTTCTCTTPPLVARIGFGALPARTSAATSCPVLTAPVSSERVSDSFTRTTVSTAPVTTPTANSKVATRVMRPRRPSSRHQLTGARSRHCSQRAPNRVQLAGVAVAVRSPGTSR